MPILKPGSLWYYRTPTAIITDIAYSKPVIIHLASFNHLNTENPQYIMLFDRTDLPQDGDLPLIEWTAAPPGLVSYTPAFGGRRFNSGLVVALSTTPVFLTAQTVPQLTYQIEGVIG